MIHRDEERDVIQPTIIRGCALHVKLLGTRNRIGHLEDNKAVTGRNSSNAVPARRSHAVAATERILENKQYSLTFATRTYIAKGGAQLYVANQTEAEALSRE